MLKTGDAVHLNQASVFIFPLVISTERLFFSLSVSEIDYNNLGSYTIQGIAPSSPTLPSDGLIYTTDVDGQQAVIKTEDIDLGMHH